MKRFKYPRTPHLPWSPGASKNDTYLVDTSVFNSQEVVVSEKYDGENTTLYPEYLHARSLDSKHHASRAWIKALHAATRHHIPPGWRLCGENLYARHSLYYDNLPSYFILFSVWNEQNECLAWTDTKAWAARLGLELPTVLYCGVWNDMAVKSLHLDTDKQEGYIVRLAASSAYEAFGVSAAKWVRQNHVQTDEHWLHRAVEPNGLKART